MKLYNLDHSPYATRVRVLLDKKGIAAEIAAPPVPLRTPQFEERFPLAKLPVLELDDGTNIADSWAIMEYLEDAYPDNAVRPSSAIDVARMRELARYTDTCLGPGALFPLFASVSNPTENAEALLADLNVELARLERLLSKQAPFSERNLHLGDIALAPSIDYVLLLAPLFGSAEPLAQYTRVNAWWQWVLEDECVAKGSQQMRTAVQAFMGAK